MALKVNAKRRRNNWREEAVVVEEDLYQRQGKRDRAEGSRIFDMFFNPGAFEQHGE